MQRLLDVLEQTILPATRAGCMQVISNNSPSTLTADRYFEAQTHPARSHTYFEWTWLVAGEATLKIAETVHPLQPGDFCLLPPTVNHVDVYNNETPGYQSVWFSYWPGVLHGAVFNYEPVGRWSVPWHGFTTGAPEIGTILIELQRELAGHEKYSREATQGLLLHLVALLIRAFEVAGGAAHVTWTGPMSGRVSYLVLRYLREHYREDISLDDVARAVYLSPNYMASTFKKETGQTISATLAQIRIEHAERMLMREGTPLQEIASAVGFNSLDRFTRVFRRIKGLPPSAYGRGGA